MNTTRKTFLVAGAALALVTPALIVFAADCADVNCRYKCKVHDRWCELIPEDVPDPTVYGYRFATDVAFRACVQLPNEHPNPGELEIVRRKKYDNCARDCNITSGEKHFTTGAPLGTLLEEKDVTVNTICFPNHS
jgi:hypothetical protein